MSDQNAHKPAKKPAKKAAAKKAPHPPEKDARRAYEHLGRVRVLLSHSKHDRKSVDTLLDFANRSFQDKKYKHAADLLRASEHLAFAGLLKDDKEEVSPELRREIENELTHLQERAANHADPEDMEEPLRSLFRTAARSASDCFDAGAFRSALDYARAAEAVSHIDDLGTLALPERVSKRLAS